MEYTGIRTAAMTAVLTLIVGCNRDGGATGAWERLWSRGDVLSAALLADGNAAEAQAMFEDPRWRATAAYRAGDYAEAERLWHGVCAAQESRASDWYNLGNALARADRLDESAEAYDTALRKDPEMADAAANRALVYAEIERRKQRDRSGGASRHIAACGGDARCEQRAARCLAEYGDKTRCSNPLGRMTMKPNPPGHTGTPIAELCGGEPRCRAAAQTCIEVNGKIDARCDWLEPMRRGAEEDRSAEATLRRVRDDPGGLLRRKFEYETNQRRFTPESNLGILHRAARYHAFCTKLIAGEAPAGTPEGLAARCY